jgi:hypothetical protein
MAYLFHKPYTNFLQRYEKHVTTLEGSYINKTGAAGFEPATIRLEGGCSIQLSYAPKKILWRD